MPAVLQRRVRAQRAQERLLERVVGGVAPEHAPQLPQHRLSLLLVEALEGWDAHDFHHPFKRGRGARL